MKCKRLLLASLVAIPLLAGCGRTQEESSNEPQSNDSSTSVSESIVTSSQEVVSSEEISVHSEEKSSEVISSAKEEITVTFTQEHADDTVITITEGMTQDQFEAAIPEVVLEGNHPGAWFDGYFDDVPEVCDITENMTFEAVYDEIRFKVTFVDEGGTAIGNVIFTYTTYMANDDHTLSPDLMPNIPGKDWYDASWGTVVLKPENFVVTPNYSLHEYTATYVDENGEIVGTKKFTKDDYDANDEHKLEGDKVIDVPVISGKDGEWDDLTITNEDKVINAVYTDHKYYIDFYISEGDHTPFATIFYFASDSSFDELEGIPTLEEMGVEGYDVSWGITQLTYSDEHMKAYPTYTGKKYNVYYLDQTSTEVTFGEEYTLKDPTPQGKDSFLYRYIDVNTNRLVNTSGTWNVAHDIYVRSVFAMGFERPYDNQIVETAKYCTYCITDQKAVEGTHSLQITYSQQTDIFVKLYDQFIIDAFDDPDVYSLTFRATADFTTNNFRHRGTDADHPNMSNICYENNQNGFGLIEGVWKTFHFTRENYNVFVNLGFDSIFVAGAQDIGKSIYIDDIRTNYIDPKLRCDFETGFINTSGSNWTVRSGAVYPFTSDHLEIQCTNANDKNTAITNVSYNTDLKYVSEGYRSLKVDLTAGEGGNYYAMWVKKYILNNMSDTDYLTFDFYAENFFSGGNVTGGCCDGLNGLLGVDLVSGKWLTISLAKSRITSDGRFLITNGSEAVGTMYFDNFRITKGQ